MSITITITDPTVAEVNALRAYFDSLMGTTAPALPEGGTRTWTEIVNTIAKDPEPDSPVTAEDAGAPDFDSAGFPWNAEIHASSRATLADGTWKKKRGVSPEEVARWEAEVKQDMANALAEDGHTAEAEVLLSSDEPTKTPEAPEVPEAPAAPEPVTTSDAPPATATPSNDAPAAPPVDTPNPFLAVMSRIGKSGMTKEQKDELLTAAGALDDKGNPSILVLNKKPELIAGFVALLDSEGV